MDQGNNELLDTEEAARFLGIARNTLEVWRSAGRYALPFVRVGRRIKYRRADLDTWLASRTACQTSGPSEQPPRKLIRPRG